MDETVVNHDRVKTYRYVFNATDVPAEDGDIRKYGSFTELKADIGGEHPMLDALLEDTPFLTITETEKTYPDGTTRMHRYYTTETEEAEEDLGYSEDDEIPVEEEEDEAVFVWYMKSDRHMACIDIRPFNAEQKQVILRCMNEGFDPDMLSKLDKNGTPLYNTEQMCQILAGKEAGLSDTDINRYSDPANSPEQMELIRTGIINSLEIKKVKMVAYPYRSESSEDIEKALNLVWRKAKEDYDMLEC